MIVCRTCYSPLTRNQLCPRCKVKRAADGRAFPRRKAGLQPCGTRAGYKRHIKRKEPACDPCTHAASQYKFNRTAGLRGIDRTPCSTCGHPVVSHFTNGRCRFIRCSCLGSPELVAREG